MATRTSQNANSFTFQICNGLYGRILGNDNSLRRRRGIFLGEVRNVSTGRLGEDRDSISDVRVKIHGAAFHQSHSKRRGFGDRRRILSAKELQDRMASIDAKIRSTWRRTWIPFVWKHDPLPRDDSGYFRWALSIGPVKLARVARRPWDYWILIVTVFGRWKDWHFGSGWQKHLAAAGGRRLFK